MEVPEFKRLLDIGLGRAILFLERNSSAPYRDVILNACLHNMALDRQAEGSRAEYMLDVIDQTGEKAFYRDRILADLMNLTPDMEDYNVGLLFDFASGLTFMN